MRRKNDIAGVFLMAFLGWGFAALFLCMMVQTLLAGGR